MKVKGIKWVIIGIYLILSAMVFKPIPAAASLVVGGSFGSNYYEFITVDDPFIGGNNSWWTARDTSSGSIYNGVNGHLATVTSSEENAFLFSLVPSSLQIGFKGAWLGGKSPDGWLVGPEAGNSFSYVNWGGSEPNNNGYAYMNIGVLSYSIESGEWADDSYTQGYPDGADPVIGYFVEYENAVPIPGAAHLFGSSLFCIVGIRRKLKK